MYKSQNTLTNDHHEVIHKILNQFFFCLSTSWINRLDFKAIFWILTKCVMIPFKLNNDNNDAL